MALPKAAELMQQTVALCASGEVEELRRASRTFRTLAVRPEVCANATITTLSMVL